MTRARSRYLGAGVFLAATAVALYFSYGVYTSPLPTNWTATYTNLKDDLRSLAINPLDPNIIYVGTDQALEATTDGGQTWTKVKSFRDNKVSVSDIVSEGALELILEIEGNAASASSSARSEDSTETSRDSRAAQVESEPRGQNELIQAQARVSEAATALDRANDVLTSAKSSQSSAEAALQSFVPDDVTVSQVEGIPEEDDGFVPQPHYDELAEWLSERALTVPENGAERKKTLVDYLQKHQEDGAALTSAYDSATVEVASAEGQVAAAQSQYDLAVGELQALEATAPDRTEEEMEITTGTDQTAEPETSATPVMDMGDVTGVTHIAIDPADPDKVYVTTFNGTYLTRDAGASWEVLYAGGNTDQATNITVTIDPSNPDNIYIGTLVGISMSKDGGTTWIRPGGQIANDVISTIAVHPFDSQVVLLGTRGDGIYFSGDGGQNWEKVFTNPATGSQNVRIVAFAPANPDIILAGTGGGVYRSLDGGRTWETASGMGLGSYVVTDLKINPADSDRIVLATWDGVFGTSNGGFQWRRLSYGLNYKGGEQIELNPLDPDQIWYLTDDRLFVSQAPEVVDMAQDEMGCLTGSCEFSFDGLTQHTLIIENVDEKAQTVTVTIQSEPQRLDLKVGKPQEVDLDGDGATDAEITLTKIVDGEPRINVYKMVKVRAVERSVTLKSADEIAGLEDLEPYFMTEPSCVEVQEAASRWAEVHPDLIEDWREGARFRAFLPQVEVQYTYGAETSDMTERYSSASREYDFYSFYQGNAEVSSSRGDAYDEGFYPSTSLGWPDTYEWYDSYSAYDEASAYTSRGDYYGTYDRDEYRDKDGYGQRNSKSWRIQLDWYLGDFLFERQQLYISREARDLVELRQDILEQVTMYYFDRKAARIDLIMNPPADPYSKLESLLNLQQLDASLDALTGGYFTRTIKDRRKEHPEVPVY